MSEMDIGKASEAERVATIEAGPLMRFAAEHIKKLDPELSVALTSARLAAEHDAWSPDVAKRFWDAFSKLCALIQPTTMDCLAASSRTMEVRRWIGFGRVKKMSLAERTSKRYLFSLGILIIIIVLLQLHVWMCTSLSKRIDEVTAADKT